VAEQQQLVVIEVKPLCLAVQHRDIVFESRHRLIWLAGHAVCVHQLSSSTCFWFADNASAALAGQQQSTRQLLKYLDGLTCVYGVCTGADATDNQGGRLGHVPAAK
jgi:hypothetical protein